MPQADLERLRACADRELARLADDGRKRTNDGSPSLMDQDRYQPFDSLAIEQAKRIVAELEESNCARSIKANLSVCYPLPSIWLAERIAAALESARREAAERAGGEQQRTLAILRDALTDIVANCPEKQPPQTLESDNYGDHWENGHDQGWWSAAKIAREALTACGIRSAPPAPTRGPSPGDAEQVSWLRECFDVLGGCYHAIAGQQPTWHQSLLLRVEEVRHRAADLIERLTRPVK